MLKGFLYIFFSHTDFPPKIQIFLVIYTRPEWQVWVLPVFISISYILVTKFDNNSKVAALLS